MKTNIIFVLLFFAFCTVAKAQHATAFTYYFVNCNLESNDVYVFTTPKAFTYIKGSTYVFAPFELEKLAEKRIGNVVKQIDTSWTGLYSNQLSNGNRIGLESYESTYQEIRSYMLKLYQNKQNQTYRDKETNIILLSLETGEVLSKSTLPASSASTRRSGTANAN